MGKIRLNSSIQLKFEGYLLVSFHDIRNKSIAIPINKGTGRAQDKELGFMVGWFGLGGERRGFV